jgi:hypothetical protein
LEQESTPSIGLPLIIIIRFLYYWSSYALDRPCLDAEQTFHQKFQYTTPIVRSLIDSQLITIPSKALDGELELSSSLWGDEEFSFLTVPPWPSLLWGHTRGL